MFQSCLAKQQAIVKAFQSCKTKEERYHQIIEWGKELPKLSDSQKTPQNIVRGCQSTMYMHAEKTEHGIIFQAESDALISAGLAAILIKVYSGESPETILKCPPTYLDELGISASLTPNRANGLYSIHLRMKQDALKFLLEK